MDNESMYAELLELITTDSASGKESAIARLLISKEYSMAAAPVVNGGIVATTTMVQACEDLGLDTAAALAPLSTPCRSSWALCPLPTAV